MVASEAYKCIGCGFCLSVCPDYLRNRMESASPRGRIFIMMRCAERGGLLPADLFDACVGCVACGKVCPASVDLEKLFHISD